MKVILVDDEAEVLDHIRYYMEQMPQITEINTFTQPLEALEHIKAQPVNVAFLDIEMYGMSGIELAKRIKDIQPKTNIVFVTGYSEYMKQAFALHVSGYLLKPVNTEAILKELDNLRYPVGIKTDIGVFVQTFGNFEVFVNGKPLAFSLSKAKELFAYLVDRYGAGVKTAEIASVLWEDKEYDRYLQNQTQKIISSMMQTLRAANIQDIVIKNPNQLSVDKTKIECDYYRLLNGDVNVLNTYAGEYMTNYSWAEMTAGVLSQRTKIQ